MLKMVWIDLDSYCKTNALQFRNSPHFMGYLKTCNFRLFHFKTDFTDILHYNNTSFKFDIWHCVIKVKVTPSVNVFFIASLNC